MKLKFTRKEYKYRMPNYLLNDAIEFFSRRLTVDPYNKNRQPYIVRSLYFDSVKFKYYFEKVSGEAIRNIF